MTLRQLVVSLQPFIDSGDDCYITVDVDGESKPEVIPLESRQARSVVRNRLCDIIKRGYPTDHELRTALDVLYGYAYEQKRQQAKASLDHLIARKPLARVVVLIAKKGGTQKTPTQLMAAVNNVARANDIDTAAGPWPTSEDSLGKQLSSLVDLLKRKGVVVEPGRSDERYWTIHPYSPGSDESVAEVSGETAVPIKTSVDHDTSVGHRPAQPNRLDPGSGGGVLDAELKTLLNGAVA